MGPETIQSLMISRAAWLDVGVVENHSVEYARSNTGRPGRDYDVVIRLDGSYSSHDDALVVAAFFRARLGAVGLLKGSPAAVQDIS
jgi:hypothetical protein